MPKYGTLTETTKWCNHCKQHKPHADFNKTKNTVHGFAVYCRPCFSLRFDAWRKKNLKFVAERQRKNYAKNKERYRGYELKNRYQISLEDYNTILKSQNSRCLICGTDKPNGKDPIFHVDHCHHSKKIRGLLCASCNMGLGLFKHNTEFLNSAIQYLAERS